MTASFLKPYVRGIIGSLIVTIALSFATIAYLVETGSNLQPSPRPTASDIDAASAYDGFPAVDWDFWRNANADIIAWISIEGTNIDLPIMRAPAHSPRFYLDHDANGNLNFTGCPYLDPACGSLILSSWNSVVYGHNMGWNDTMFADLARYAESDFACEHPTVLLQTPYQKMRLRVKACDVVPGWVAGNRTRFSHEEDFREWWSQTLRNATVVIDDSGISFQPVLTLCTCSYGIWDDERTIVYCQCANG